MKAGGEENEKALQLATNMANSITKAAKATRRSVAAKASGYTKMAKIFADRAKELAANESVQSTNPLASHVITKMKAENIKDFSDEELHRIFDNTASPVACFNMAKKLVADGLKIEDVQSGSTNEDDSYNEKVKGLISKYLGTDKVISAWIDDNNAQHGNACVILSNFYDSAKEIYIENGYMGFGVYEYEGITWIKQYGQPDSYWFKKADLDKILSYTSDEDPLTYENFGGMPTFEALKPIPTLEDFMNQRSNESELDKYYDKQVLTDDGKSGKVVKFDDNGKLRVNLLDGSGYVLKEPSQVEIVDKTNEDVKPLTKATAKIGTPVQSTRPEDNNKKGEVIPNFYYKDSTDGTEIMATSRDYAAIKWEDGTQGYRLVRDLIKAEAPKANESEEDQLMIWKNQLGDKATIEGGSLKYDDYTVTPNGDGTYEISNPAAVIDHKASLIRVEQILELREEDEINPAPTDESKKFIGVKLSESIQAELTREFGSYQSVLEAESDFDLVQKLAATGDGGSIKGKLVDAGTASLVMQIYNALNDENKKLFSSFDLDKLARISWKLAARHGATYVSA